MPDVHISAQTPLLLGVIMVVHLIRQPKYAIAYVILSTINIVFNRVLKRIYNQPRPTVSTDDKTYDDYYGMPSGHAQHILFTLVFLVFVRPSWIVFWLCLTVGVFGVVERYANRRHSIEQLFVGGIIGGIFAVVSVIAFRKLLFFLEKEKYHNIL